MTKPTPAAHEIRRALCLSPSEISELTETDRANVLRIRELHRRFWGNGHCVHRGCTVCFAERPEPS